MTSTMMPPPLPEPPPPLRPSLAHAFGGVWRLTWPRYLARGPLLGLLLSTGALLLLTGVVVRMGDANDFYEWVISFYLTIVVPILAFVAGGGSVRDDMKPGTIDFVLTRPIRRWAFLTARFGSQLACLLAIHLLVLAALMAVGRALEIRDVVSTFPTLWFAQVVTLTTFLAMGYICGAATGRYLVLGIVYAGTIEMGLGNVPIQLSKLSIMRHVRAYLAERFPAVIQLDVEPQGWAVTLGVMLAFVAVWVVGAVLLFSVQEFAGQRPKEA